MKDFKLERYFDKYEFCSKHLLCSSDCETFTTRELLELAGESANYFLNTPLGYTTSKGDIKLRQQIANLYNTISFENVLTFAGAQEAIYVFNRSLFLEDDEIIVQFPCYQSLYQIADEIGCAIKYWRMDPNNGWILDIEELKNLISEKTKCIVLNFPNNPTGYIIKNDLLDEVIEIARQYNIYILCDEVYRFLEYDKKYTLLGICDKYEKGISVGVLSKSFGFPGLRIGWIATKNEEIYQQMCKYKDYTSLCNNVLGEKFGVLVLKNKEKILKRNLEIIKDNINYFKIFLSKYPNTFDCEIPKGGSVLFVKLNIKIPALEFSEKINQSKSLFILPSEVFNYHSEYIRIGIGRKSFKEALDVLEDYVLENELN